MLFSVVIMTCSGLKHKDLDCCSGWGVILKKNLRINKKKASYSLSCVFQASRGPEIPVLYLRRLYLHPFLKLKAVFAVATEHERTTEVGVQARKHEFVILRLIETFFTF